MRSVRLDRVVTHGISSSVRRKVLNFRSGSNADVATISCDACRLLPSDVKQG